MTGPKMPSRAAAPRHIDRDAVAFDLSAARQAAAAAGDERQTWAYDWPQGRALVAALPQLVNLAGARVVDLGCGRGQLGWRAWELGAEQVTWLDASPQIIAYQQAIIDQFQLSQNCNAVVYQWGTLAEAQPSDRSLPALIGSSDVVLGGDILYRPECFEALSSDLATMLAPEGMAIFCDPRRTIEDEWYASLHAHGLHSQVMNPSAPAEQRGTVLAITRS